MYLTINTASSTNLKVQHARAFRRKFFQISSVVSYASNVLSSQNAICSETFLLHERLIYADYYLWHVIVDG